MVETAKIRKNSNATFWVIFIHCAVVECTFFEKSEHPIFYETNLQKQRHPIVYTVPIKILKTLESPHEKWCVAGESFCEF